MYKNYEIIKFFYKNSINICYIQFTIFKCLYTVNDNTFKFKLYFDFYESSSDCTVKETKSVKTIYN